MIRLFGIAGSWLGLTSVPASPSDAARNLSASTREKAAATARANRFARTLAHIRALGGPANVLPRMGRG